MGIKVKHDGNATPSAFAAAAGGQGKRAQQDAAQMSQVMQSAANAGNQQLRGASAPGAAPGRSSAQLVHAQAPTGGGGGMSGVHGASDWRGTMNDPYEQAKINEQRFAHERDMSDMDLWKRLAIISRQAGEQRGTMAWGGLVEQSQHPDVPEKANGQGVFGGGAGVQLPGQEGKGVKPLRPYVVNPTDTSTNINKPSRVPVTNNTYQAVSDSFISPKANSQTIGEGGMTPGEVTTKKPYTEDFKSTVRCAFNNVKRETTEPESRNKPDVLEELVSIVTGRPDGRGKITITKNDGAKGFADGPRSTGTKTFIEGEAYDMSYDNKGNEIFSQNGVIKYIRGKNEGLWEQYDGMKSLID